MLRILSLGAGVQSTTVALMSLRGELPPIDAAIFADTGWEPKAVYGHLWTLAQAFADADVPLYVVSAGDIREDHADPKRPNLFIRNPKERLDYLGRQRTFMPFFTNTDGSKGLTRRTCTRTYKIEPVERRVRDLLGLRPGRPWPTDLCVEQLFGISLDETQRMKDSPRPCIRNVYPLVDLRMTRADCLAWLADRGLSAPRSACIGCPYHSDTEWRRLRDDAPEEFADAVDFDREFRRRQQAGLVTLDGEPFLHSSLLPLDQVDFRTETDHGQGSLFTNECEGMCGL